MTPDHRPPTVAQHRFAEVAARLEHLDLADRPTFIHRTNLRAGFESRSGVGSSLAPTARLRAELPLLLRRLGVRSLLDVPCGDFHWISALGRPRLRRRQRCRSAGALLVPYLLWVSLAGALTLEIWRRNGG